MQATLPLKPDLIANLMISALEVGSNYWARSATLTNVHPASGDPQAIKTAQTLLANPLYYADEALYRHDFTIEMRFDDPDTPDGGGEKKKNITNVDLQRAVVIIADKYPQHLSGVFGYDDDAITADVFLQCAVFGEIVYG